MSAQEQEPGWVEAALRAGPTGAWRLDVARGRVDLWNPPQGLDLPDVCTKDALLARVHPEDISSLQTALDEVLSGAQDNLRLLVRLRGADGAPRWVVMRAVAVRGPDGAVEVVQGILREDPLRTIEERRRHDHAMHSLGTLAGGVAHDFNNLLLTVLGNADLALADVHVDPVAAGHAIDQIRVAAERGSKLTRRLLTFASRQQLHETSVRPGEILADLLPMLRRLIPEPVSLDVGEMPAGRVNADAGQLEEVVMNLVVNARDAIEGPGRINIEARIEQVAEGSVRAQVGAAPGSYFVLRVQDDGVGMSEAVRSRAFEPFFTTKPHGSGTGLGLSIVYGIVRRHEGFVEVVSEPKRGTTFDVFLPLREDAPAPREASPSAFHVKGGSEVVLLAEDEESVGKLACAMLERAGYEVVFAKNGREAMARFLEAPERFDLVVLDVVMPGLSGEQVFNEIRPRRPALPVIFSSGYSAGVIAPEVLAQPDCYALGKPYDRAQLLTLVRKALDKAAYSDRK